MRAVRFFLLVAGISLIAMNTHAVPVKYFYDLQGRLIAASYDDGVTCVLYTYDDNGNRTSVSSPGTCPS